ncbi:MAG: flippase [Gemmatimonadetes bacterium]|nr:flippase [Gemmatimonadota bacterium]
MSGRVQGRVPDAAIFVTRSFAALGAGELLARLIGFGGTIWIARVLGVDMYGIVGFAMALTLYLTGLVDAGLEQHGPHEIAERRLPPAELISSVLLARTLIALALLAVVAAGGLLGPRPDGVVVAMFALTLIPAGVNSRWAHFGLDNGAIVARTRVATETVRVALLLVFVHGPDDVLLVPLAQLVGDALAAGWLLAEFRRRGIELRWRFDRALAAGVLRRAAPLLGTHLLALAIYNADVILLRVFRDVSAIGLYLAAYSLINFLGALGNVVTVSLVPSLSRLRADAAAGADLAHTALARVLVVGLPVAVGGALLASRIIEFVFHTDYARAGPVLAILIWTIPALLLRSVFMAVLISRGRQGMVLRMTGVAAALNIGTNLVAIPLFGMMGAAATTLLAELARMTVGGLYVAREGVPAAPLGRYARTGVAAAVMGGALFLLQRLPLALAIMAGAIVFFTTLTVTGGIRLAGGRPSLSV